MNAMRAGDDRDRRAPGRPRSARADQAIIEAVLGLLGDGTPLEALSVEAVAARAGVGKATIYRRWASKDALVLEAVSTLKPPPPDVPGESVREDLILLLSTAGAVRAGAPERVLPCLMPQMAVGGDFYGLYQAMIEPRREAVRRVLRRGIRTGELRPDLDIEVAVAALGGTMMLQRTVRWNPALETDDLPGRLVDLILAGAAARTEGAPVPAEASVPAEAPAPSR